ncbi:MAG TPA: DivIVA domain-containing protein [bacterium]|jgi:DivIVA domain-containing protein
MSLTPLDVSKHEFERSFRGYDPNDVQAFLERVADEVAALQTQVNSLSEQNRVLAAKLGAYQDMEQGLRDSIVATEKSLKSTRDQVEIERQQILREAKLDSDQMKLATQNEITHMREELRALKIHHDAYVKRLRFLLKAQTELLDLLEEQSPEMPHDSIENATR